MYGAIRAKRGEKSSTISEVVNYVTCFVNVHGAFLLCFDHDGVLAPANLKCYTEAIYRAGALLSSTWYQRQAYNGYKKYHTLKFQAVMLSNGMFGHLHGPLNDSRLINLLQEHANEAMFAVHTNVENGLALVVKEWPFLYLWWKMSLYSSPVGVYYCFGVLLMNARNCMQYNQIAITFDCVKNYRSPSLAEYSHALQLPL
ncbi:uncharacterized protein SCHCODRAFT_02673817 [Schizophyllum commune H4-8]|uniref:uncharacterized protein n=1 Tax=Schizophyllum commune (strain H4-8 / FGSC 9210) TaxID=578458 RepID=UPI002160B638|nr:uncharacterized protein SCHCODRAFT_02673817 [Schizophyllum commune H4-8]KAI5885228.1 hypothetical protein SCHCODRAFT_02673817 [Schizophyllum commune H4-8]